MAYSNTLKELSYGKAFLTEEAKKTLTHKLEEFLPGAGLAFLISLSADSVAAELAPE